MIGPIFLGVLVVIAVAMRHHHHKRKRGDHDRDDDRLKMTIKEIATKMDLRQGTDNDIKFEEDLQAGGVDPNATIKSVSLVMTPGTGTFGVLTPNPTDPTDYDLNTSTGAIGDTAHFDADATVDFTGPNPETGVHFKASLDATLTGDPNASDVLKFDFARV